MSNPKDKSPAAIARRVRMDTALIPLRRANSRKPKKERVADSVILDAVLKRERELQRQLAAAKFDAKQGNARADRAEQALIDQQQIHAAKVRPLTILKPGKAAKHSLRVVIPDSHGNHIEPDVAAAFLADLKWLDPQEIVMLGDHLDCGGTFNAHQRSYTNELSESYVDDLAAANAFLDKIREYAPNARIHYLEGNHEAHVERWAARNMHVRADADLLIEVMGPEAQLKLRTREIKYYRTKEFYHGLSVPGSIKLGKCHFTHGISHSQHAETTHLNRFNGNVQFGHVHRAIAIRSRTVTSKGHGAWCSGTLAKLQPLYKHTQPTTWSHGYGLDFVSENSGRFCHYDVPIFGKESMLAPLVGAVRERVA